MQKIQKRLGGALYQQIKVLLQQALAEQQRGDNSLHREWIRRVLSQYYDPMYAYQLLQREDAIEFSGSAEQVREYLLESAGSV